MTQCCYTVGGWTSYSVDCTRIMEEKVKLPMIVMNHDVFRGLPGMSKGPKGLDGFECQMYGQYQTVGGRRISSTWCFADDDTVWVTSKVVGGELLDEVPEYAKDTIIIAYVNRQRAKEEVSDGE